MEHAAGRTAASDRAEKDALDAFEFDWATRT